MSSSTPRLLPSFCSPRTENLIRLWLIRALLDLDGVSGLIGYLNWEDSMLAGFLDLNDCENADGDIDRDAVIRKLSAERERLTTRCSFAVPSRLARNIDSLRNRYRLSRAATQILEFAILVRTVNRLGIGLERIGLLDNPGLYHALSVILQIRESDVRRELSSTGTLSRLGLLTIWDREVANLRARLDLFSSEFAERMVLELDAPHSVFRDVFVPATEPTLSPEAFRHVDIQKRVLMSLIRRGQGKRGINALIYGPPGTGKTELVRVVATEAKCALMEVAAENRHGVPVDGNGRLRAYIAGQMMLTRGKSVLLFDEAEDVFGRDDPFAESSVVQTRKAWMNRALEENAVPTVWVCNSIDGIDPAFLRRFAIIVQMPRLPLGHLESLGHKLVGDLLPRHHIAQLASSDGVVPGVLAKSAAVIRMVKDDFAPGDLPAAAAKILDGTLVAQGYRGVGAMEQSSIVANYDPDMISADFDPKRVMDGIRRSRQARICLYGPPGTGKSAFGRWLAGEIGAPLHAKKLSDILSQFVGESERNLANVFRAAQVERAVLMLDEVDGLLQDRREARVSWERTQVNEMLMQMESFQGVLIASTNLMDGLDEAAARRFDLKVRFAYLKPEQITAMLVRHQRSMGLSCSQAEADTAVRVVRDLKNLTPGDFAAAARRHMFSPFPGVIAFAEAVASDAAFKRDRGVGRIGFVG